MQRNIITGLIVLVALGVIYSFTISDNGNPSATPSASPNATSSGTSASAIRALQVFLAGKTGLAADAIAVSNIEEKQWPDGCLGLPFAGELCTQVITPGYRAKITIGGMEYFYRVDINGSRFRLEK
ncbi:MAG: hypothetical protein AAB864_00560 [Patescibacteria group bacterium]